MAEDDVVQNPAGTDRKLRLGVLIRRFREAKGVNQADLAVAIGIPHSTMVDVENGLVSLKAEQLQTIASILDVLYEPLLIAARDWNRAVFEQSGSTGVQLAEVTVTERALRGGEELLERELIRAADDLAFVSNVARELSIRAERASLRARALLAERGVPIPDPPPEQIVECSGPVHDDFGGDGLPRPKLRLGRDYVLSFQPPSQEGDRDDKVYFCSEGCADAYRVAFGYDPIPREEQA